MNGIAQKQVSKIHMVVTLGGKPRVEVIADHRVRSKLCKLAPGASPDCNNEGRVEIYPELITLFEQLSEKINSALEEPFKPSITVSVDGHRLVPDEEDEE